MTSPKPPTRKQIIQDLLRELDGVAPIDDVIERALQILPSKAKNPKQSVRTNVRSEQVSYQIVFLDAQTILPIRLALKDVRFRIKLDAMEVQRGILSLFPAFQYFLRPECRRPVFVDEHDQPIATQVVKHSVQMNDPLFGRQTLEIDALDLGKWFANRRVRKHDDVLLTILDWETGRIRLEHEPAKMRRESLIAQQNLALADMLYELMEETVDERVMLHVAIPTAYARLPGARDYPGDHWMFVIDRDERIRSDGFQILPADQLLPFERMFMGITGESEASLHKKSFTREQGWQVYRFSARSRYRKRARIIEIQGRQTRGAFDEMMRDAFDLDFSDHLSEFTRVIPRGKGKRPRQVPFGELYPPGTKPTAAKLRVAELGLEVGATLEYVYDFGDWIAHNLTLEKVEDPEPGVKYPRMLESKRS